MGTRVVLRYVRYVMRRHPSAETTATARCLNADCNWAAEPTGNADVCTDMCIQHTGHMVFIREFSEVAVMERIQ
uniref:Transposase MuDR plant domain-containing protein n=1 Tax=Streptomyces sp. NBC_00049 TaxID=2903617 RepID=A0AAU2JXJ8_9ACTN